jgi:hypothetical protein
MCNRRRYDSLFMWLGKDGEGYIQKFGGNTLEDREKD